MYRVNALLDMHERGQRSLQKLLLHCGQLNAEELDRELPGFGYPNVRQQLEHVIGAQEYWISVVQGRFTGEFSSTEYPTVEALGGLPQGGRGSDRARICVWPRKQS